MNTENYIGMIQYLDYLQTQGVQICIKDYVGYLALNRDFERCMGKYLAHSKPFCKYIKSDKAMFSQCIKMMKKLNNIFSEGKSESICGICHAGIKEYVVPIWYKGKVIGSVHAGIFACGRHRAEYRIRKICERSAVLDKDVAIDLYYKSVNELKIDENTLIASMHLIANSVSLSVGASLNSIDIPVKKRATVLTENTIIAEAQDYLRTYYNSPCNVKALASYCHCSRSQISHIFKVKTGVSIPVFVNSLRIEQAKELLRNTSETVNNISYAVGFNDPNYFSKVFCHYTGLSCSEYRKQNKSEPNSSIRE